MEHTQSMTLTERDHTELLRLARRSIEAGLDSGHLAQAPIILSDALNLPRATFVTLREHSDLRGCCGSIEPRFGLAEDVWRNAWASAFADPRFPPLAREEYPSIDLHVSVLSELERLPVHSERELVNALRPGRDGLLLQHGSARATFLPAVWENIPHPSEFVGHLKSKAGWRPDFWSPDIEVWRYETESFGEHA